MSVISRKSHQFVVLIALNPNNCCPDNQEFCVDNKSLVFTSTQAESSDAILSVRYDLIIVDLRLNGLEMLALAKKTGCINYDTPIIALVDVLAPNQAKSLVASGFDDVLTKPLTKEAIEETINLWAQNDDLTPFLVAVETLLDKSLGNKALTLTLFTKLFEELPKQIHQLEEAFLNKNFQLAYDVNHKLNGSAKTCYLQNIQDIANNLENSLTQKNYDFAEGYFWIMRQKVLRFLGYRQNVFEHLAAKL